MHTARLLLLIAQHPGFIWLSRRESGTHLLVMEDHEGRSWVAAGKLEDIIDRAYAELPLTE